MHLEGGGHNSSQNNLIILDALPSTYYLQLSKRRTRNTDIVCVCVCVGSDDKSVSVTLL